MQHFNFVPEVFVKPILEWLLLPEVKVDVQTL
jgi:hypothetical protein